MERTFIGAWTTDEVNKAIDKDYKILTVYEIWHFDKTIDGLFKNLGNDRIGKISVYKHCLCYSIMLTIGTKNSLFRKPMRPWLDIREFKKPRRLRRRKRQFKVLI